VVIGKRRLGLLKLQSLYANELADLAPGAQCLQAVRTKREDLVIVFSHVNSVHIGFLSGMYG
jgi:hypothetical protein